MAVEMLAKMTLTKTTCRTSMTCVPKTLALVRQTSASSRWCLWTRKAPPRLILTGSYAIRAKSSSRRWTVTLALLLVSKTCDCHHSPRVCLQSPNLVVLLRQGTTSLMQWTSVGLSSSTQSGMMIMPALCLATSPVPGSTWWCGSRLHRPTGQINPPRPRGILAFPLKW